MLRKTLIGFFLTGMLAVSSAVGAEIFVRVGPPRPIIERRGPAPGRDYVWFSGYHTPEDGSDLPGRTAAVLIGQREVGTVGELHPRVCASFDIDGPVAMFELDIDALRPHLQPAVHYQPVSPFPPVEQDLALILPAETEAARPLQIIADDSLVENVSVFDVYTGPPVPPGRKSIAFAISFRSPDHTLTDEEVARHRRKIIARLERDLDAEVRA